jgi:hypothetical protein
MDINYDPKRFPSYHFIQKRCWTQPITMASQSKAWCLRPLTCWYWGFASCRRHGFVTLVSVVFCQEEVTESGWSLVQRGPIDFGVSGGDRDASIAKTSGQQGDIVPWKRERTVHTRMWFTLSRNKSLRIKGKSFLELFRWTYVPLRHVSGITEIDSQVINKMMSTRGKNLSSWAKRNCLIFHKESCVPYLLFLGCDRKIPNMSGSYWRNFSANNVVSGHGGFKLLTNFCYVYFLWST